MGTAQGYRDDPFQCEFTAEVLETRVLPDQRLGVVLDRTWFFPTGGGQEHDSGTLGEAQVTDVFEDEAGHVIHVIDRPLSGVVPARIDWPRRFAFMQHHSGQHLLSAAIDQALGLGTVSSRISIDSPSTIDTPWRDVSDSDRLRVENDANAVIYADRLIKSYTITDAQVPTIPFRRPPKVEGEIRVIEIEGLDYSACGGTHCTRTGMIGILKIVKFERRGDKARFYFVAGDRALSYFQLCHAAVVQAAQRLSTSPEALPEAVARLADQLDAARDELEDLAAERLQMQVKRLIEGAETVGTVRLATALLNGQSAQQLRVIGSQLQNEPGLVAFLATHDGTKLSLVVTCAAGTGLAADDLLRKQLAEIGGRGGGDVRLAQGGGTADGPRVAALWGSTRDLVRQAAAS